MDTKLPSEVNIILERFQKAGYQIYIIGGAVRDLLMGKEVGDWDFTTDAKPEEILKVIPEGFYDNKFGTVGLAVGDGVFEITTMRKEGKYEDFRHPTKIVWTNKIAEDLARRDFTINAIALSTVGDLVDPFNGQQDIKDKLIRTVGNPGDRFKEDSLRLMRAVRFATELDFEIDPETTKAIKVNVDLIKEIAWERIRDELFKILGSARL